jgi:hypothetical protein
MSAESLDYLRKEVRQEREQIQWAAISGLQRACAMDLLEFFDRRIDVAFEMERQARIREAEDFAVRLGKR